MNTPPTTFTRIPVEALRDFVAEIGMKAGLPGEKAELLARMLIENDLRGNFSHGTQQIRRYAIQMRDGALNARPDVRVVKETPMSLLVDGDGGLGYFPAHDGTLRMIEKTKSAGAAILVTRNHGHFGAAGLYVRMTLEHDLLTFCTSGVQLHMTPGKPIHAAAGGSPIAFSAPAGEEDPFVLDFGTMHDLYERNPHRDEIAKLAPGMVYRSIGLGSVCQIWGGLLAGIPADESRADRRFPGATQGCCLFAFKISLFAAPERFKSEMDDYVRQAAALKGLDGSRGYLAGGPEAERAREWERDGIPAGPDHQKNLKEAGREFGVRWP